MKHLVIYHANCMDGFGSAWCVWKLFGGNNVEFYPGYYGAEPPLDRIDGETEVIVLDFSYPLEQMQSIHLAAKHVTWLDHHHTAEPITEQLRSWLSEQPKEALKGSYIRFDQERSGVTLAFEHYLASQYRTIPRLLLCIEDQDLWRFNLPETEAVSSALQSHPMDFEVWDQLIHGDLQEMVVEGRVIRRYFQEQLNRVVAHAAPVTLGGIKGMAVNANSLFVSEAGEAWPALAAPLDWSGI